MAKKGKGKGFLGAVGSFFGSIPAVKSVKKAAKSVKKKVKKAKKKLKKVVKKAKKKLKKKIGKVFTKARKLKNKLSKSKLVKKIKRAAKKVVLAGKKAVKKGKKYAKAAVKVVKKTAKKVAVAAKKVNVREAISTAADFIPVVGNVKSAYEAIVGKDPITGRKLDKWERAVSAAGIVGGPAVKGAKKIGGAAVEGFVNAGKKGSKTKPPTTGKKSAAAAPKKPPATGGQKVATAAPKKPPTTGGQKVAVAPKKPPTTGGQKVAAAPKKPPATGGQKVATAAPKKPNPNNTVQQKVAYKEPPKKPNQKDTQKTKTVYKDTPKSNSQVNSLPKAVGETGSSKVTPTTSKTPKREVSNKIDNASRSDLINEARDYARQQLNEHVQFLKQGGIKKPIDSNGYGGGNYKPGVITAAIDISTVRNTKPNIKFGYNGRREGQFNPSVTELHKDLLNIIDNVKEQAKKDPNNEFKDIGSFEKWDVENCAEIQAVNQILHSGAKIDNILISTVNGGTGRYKAPCGNCQKTFVDFINDFY